MTDILAGFRNGGKKDTANSIPTSEDDPRLSWGKDFAKKKGMNYKDAFFAGCKEKGIDTTPIINTLRALGINV